MEAESDFNLQKLIGAYQELGYYFLAPAEGDLMSGINIDLNRSIRKRALNIRDAWQIGEHDPDAVAIGREDKPRIPKDQKDAPVLALLQRESRY